MIKSVRVPSGFFIFIFIYFHVACKAAKPVQRDAAPLPPRTCRNHGRVPRRKEGMLVTSGPGGCSPSRRPRCVMLQQHISHAPERNAGGFGIPLLAALHVQPYSAYAVLEYKMLLPRRRAAEPQRWKERSSEREDHLPADSGNSPTSER